MSEQSRRGGKSNIRVAPFVFGKEREQHMEFLNDHLDEIMEANAEAYQEHGRGLWMFRDDPNNDGTLMGYVCNRDVDKLPDDDMGKRVRGMVTHYTPDTQAVVVLVDIDGDSAHAYTIGARSSERK